VTELGDYASNFVAISRRWFQVVADGELLSSTETPGIFVFKGPYTENARYDDYTSIYGFLSDYSSLSHFSHDYPVDSVWQYYAQPLVFRRACDEHMCLQHARQITVRFLPAHRPRRGHIVTAESPDGPWVIRASWEFDTDLTTSDYFTSIPPRYECVYYLDQAYLDTCAERGAFCATLPMQSATHSTTDTAVFNEAQQFCTQNACASGTFTCDIDILSKPEWGYLRSFGYVRPLFTCPDGDVCTPLFDLYRPLMLEFNLTHEVSYPPPSPPFQGSRTGLLGRVFDTRNPGDALDLVTDFDNADDPDALLLADERILPRTYFVHLDHLDVRAPRYGYLNLDVYELIPGEFMRIQGDFVAGVEKR